MKPTQLIIDASNDVLAADTATLAPAALGNKVSLVIAPFTPGRTTAVADLTLATFTGSAAKVAGPTTQQVGNDPNTGEQFIQLLEPAGGWTWTCTVAPASPETVVGYVVTDNGVSDTYGSDLLPTPVTIANVGDTVTIPWIRLTQNANPYT